MGSPRKAGNTAALLAPFCEALEQGGAETETVWLYDREIRPCRACRICQRDWTVFGCPQEDDVQDLFDRVLAAACENAAELCCAQAYWYKGGFSG